MESSGDQTPGKSGFGKTVKRILPKLFLSIHSEEIFDSHGLYARAFGFAGQVFSSQIIVNGKKVLGEKDPYTHIDFTPRGTQKRDPSNITDALANGIRGFTELVAAIDARKVKLPPVFVGTTNLEMAIISQKLGFIIVDSSKGLDGKIDKSRQNFTVVGNLDAIRENLAEITKSKLSEKILRRDRRLKETSQPETLSKGT